MKGNLAGLMQQAQKMQQEMQKAQEELASLEVTGEAGGGLVKVTMTGKHAVRRVEIDPSLLEDKEMLEGRRDSRSQYDRSADRDGRHCRGESAGRGD